MEIASFDKLENYQVDFIEKVGSNIASTVESVRTNIKTSELLEKSQQQAEEMSAQEEEMRQNMEELQATQEEAARRENELQSLLEAIDKFLLKAEINLDGQIENANDLFLKTLGFEMDELQGNDYKKLVPENEREAFDNIWSKITSGETFQGQLENLTKDKKKVSLVSSYIPVQDKDGNINKILYLAVRKNE
jgi:PAS domain S-box-containing protein